MLKYMHATCFHTDNYKNRCLQQPDLVVKITVKGDSMKCDYEEMMVNFPGTT